MSTKLVMNRGMMPEGSLSIFSINLFLFMFPFNYDGIVWLGQNLQETIVLKLIYNSTSEERIKVYCTGKRLDCAIARMKSKKSMALQQNLSEAFGIDMTEPLRIYEKIGSVPKPSASMECLPACEVQENFNQMSFALYPQKDNFFFQ